MLISFVFFFEDNFSHGYKLYAAVCLRLSSLKNIYCIMTLLVVCIEEIDITNKNKKNKNKESKTWYLGLLNKKKLNFDEETGGRDPCKKYLWEEA